MLHSMAKKEKIKKKKKKFWLFPTFSSPQDYYYVNFVFVLHFQYTLEITGTTFVKFSLNNLTTRSEILNVENSKSFLTMGGRVVIGPKGVGKFILFIRWSTLIKRIKHLKSNRKIMIQLTSDSVLKNSAIIKGKKHFSKFHIVRIWHF